MSVPPDLLHEWHYHSMGKYVCHKCGHKKKSRLTPTPDVLIFKMVNNKPYRMNCGEVQALGVMLQ